MIKFDVKMTTAYLCSRSIVTCHTLVFLSFNIATFNNYFTNLVILVGEKHYFTRESGRRGRNGRKKKPNTNVIYGILKMYEVFG